MTTYFQLFISMFQIGLFSIGGGYVAIPLIQNQMVDIRQWLTATEFTDIITIAEMTPGPIAINAATFVGIRVAGAPGAIIATLACILPPCVIVLLLAKVYYRYRQLDAVQSVLSCLRPAVVAMIASAGLGILRLALFRSGQMSFADGNFGWDSFALFTLGLLALRIRKVSPLAVIGAAGAIGLAINLLTGG